MVGGPCLARWIPVPHRDRGWCAFRRNGHALLVHGMVGQRRAARIGDTSTSTISTIAVGEVRGSGTTETAELTLLSGRGRRHYRESRLELGDTVTIVGMAVAFDQVPDPIGAGEAGGRSARSRGAQEAETERPVAGEPGEAKRWRERSGRQRSTRGSWLRR